MAETKACPHTPMMLPNRTTPWIRRPFRGIIGASRLPQSAPFPWRTILCLATILTAAPFLPLVAENQEPDYVLLHDGSLIRGEVIKQPVGYFLRDGKNGTPIATDQLAAVFTPSHFREITASSPRAAAMESLLRFNAGERFVWNPEGQFSFFKNDTAVRLSKFTLLALSALGYFQVRRANERIIKNENYLKMSALHSDFMEARNRYYGALGLTIGFFVFETGYAGFNFGRHIDGTDLRIGKQEPIPVGEYIERSNRGSHSCNQIHLTYQIRF